MKKLFVYLLNIITILFVSSAPTKITNPFEIASAEFATCPELRLSSLVNQSIEYLKYYQNFPKEQLNEYNKDNYLWVGVLDAELQLCKMKFLPKPVDLKKEIDKISSEPPDEVCKGFMDFNRTEIQLTNKYMIELNKLITNKPFCINLCSGFLQRTNDLCSLIHFIHKNIEEIKYVVKTTQSTIRTTQDISTKLLNTNQIDKKTVIKSDMQLSSDNSSNKTPGKNENNQITIQGNILKNPESSSLFSVEVKSNYKSTSTSNKIEITQTAVNSFNNEPEASKEKIVSTASPPKLNVISNSEIVKNPTIKSSQIDEHTTVKEQSTINKNEIEEHKTINGKQESDLKSAVTEKKISDLKFDYDESATNPDPEPLYDDANDFESKDTASNLVPQKEVINAIPISSSNKNNMNYEEVEDSNFFSYFMFISVVFICGYIAYHNKQKILALVLEGRRERGSRRRPNTASYRKLNSNLEEAVTSKSSGSAAHVIY